MTAPKLTGNRCQCPTCGEYFTSTRAFDRHRIGQFGNDRRCLTATEMDAAGLGEGSDARRRWVEPAQKNAKCSREHFARYDENVQRCTISPRRGPRGTLAMGQPSPEPGGLKNGYLEAA